MNKEPNEKSLFLYTALIFVVALIMIIISFFGQSNLEKNQLSDQNATSISQRAAVLSEENMLLREQNLDMQEKIETQESTVADLQSQVDKKDTQIHAMNQLLNANSLYAANNAKGAKEILEKLNTDVLSEDGKTLYNQLIEKLN